MSLVACLLLPCLPLMIEMLKDGKVEKGNVVITVSILAATFIFTAGHTIIQVIYVLLFVAALLLNLVHGDLASQVLNDYSGTLIIGVAFLHAAERFWWHVALDVPFPENKRSP